jgi:sugar phosphate isomerase/epimerase
MGEGFTQMKIGIMTAAFPNLSLEDVVQFASINGFQTLEVACWPAGEERNRKYGGVVHIDVNSLTISKVTEIKGMLSEMGVEISALGYYPNPLHPDPLHRKHVIEHLKRVIIGAEKLGVGIIGTLVGRSVDYETTGRYWRKDIDYNFHQFIDVWPDIVHFAADHNVMIATEHCPMLFPDTWPGGDNLPYSPSIFQRMFEVLPDKNFGIMFDPSHFVWLHIDHIRFIHDFADRIFAIHAQDMAVDEEKLYQHGILGCDYDWKIPRLPGQGLIDWKELITALYDVGYDSTLNIEHEDPHWEGNVELVKRGFLLAKKTLALYTA